MAATCMAVCKGSRKKIRGIFISSCHLPVAVECDIVILSEPGPIPQAPVGQFCRHNLSPRGDGNLRFPEKHFGQSGTQLIPARGRKRLRRIGRSSRVPDTTYPREGTETLRRIGRSSRVPRHNLSPRGDGNWPVAVPQLIPRDTTYPREGTETLSQTMPTSSIRTQLIPARGRKLML